MGHLTPRLPFGALISRLLRAIVDPCDKLDEKISFLLIIPSLCGLVERLDVSVYPQVQTSVAVEMGCGYRRPSFIPVWRPREPQTRPAFTWGPLQTSNPHTDGGLGFFFFLRQFYMPSQLTNRRWVFEVVRGYGMAWDNIHAYMLHGTWYARCSTCAKT